MQPLNLTPLPSSSSSEIYALYVGPLPSKSLSAIRYNSLHNNGNVLCSTLSNRLTYHYCVVILRLLASYSQPVRDTPPLGLPLYLDILLMLFITYYYLHFLSLIFCSKRFILNINFRKISIRKYTLCH